METLLQGVCVIEEDNQLAMKEQEEKTIEIGVVSDITNQKSDDDNDDDVARNDPKEWIKENNIQKNNLTRRTYLHRLGIKDSRQMSKEMFEEMTRLTQPEILDKAGNVADRGEKDLNLENSYSSGSFSLNFPIKSDDEMRKSFIDKLTSMRMLKRQPVKKHQTRIYLKYLGPTKLMLYTVF